MTPKDVIKNTIETGQMILTTYISDLTDAELMERPEPGCNHLAWQLGHLITSERKMLTDAGFDAPALPDGFTEAYATETCSCDDAAKFHKKAEYQSLMETQRAATLGALDGMSVDDLGKESPEAMRAYAPTVASVFNLMGLHLVMHAGQFIPVRRRLGKPVLI